MDTKSMSETDFAKLLITGLKPLLPQRYEVETKRSILYAVSFDDRGNLLPRLNRSKEPVRGGGTGFEQDVLIFERNPDGYTSIIPRVAIEVKFSSVTTHDAIVYSEKARRIRTIYPYVRYGLVLGNEEAIPARVLRLGSEFDFIQALPENLGQQELAEVAELLKKEIWISCQLTKLLNGQTRVAMAHRELVLH